MSFVHTLGLIATLLIVSCGPPRGSTVPRDEDLRSLTEARALTLVQETLTEQSFARGAAFPLDIGGSEPFEVDVRVADTRFGIEWVSAQDRVNATDLPEPPEGNQLQILPGRGDDSNVEVLLLDSARYRYDPDRDRVWSGSVSSSEVEARLRRDIGDFVEYLRGQL